MPSLRSAWVPFDLGVKMDNADITDADVVIVCVPLPFAGTIKEIWFVADVLPTAATVTVEKAVGAVDVSVLAATHVPNTDLTANVAAKVTVSTDKTALKFAAGDMLRATWTFTTIASGDGFGCWVMVEPDTW